MSWHEAHSIFPPISMYSLMVLPPDPNTSALCGSCKYPSAATNAESYVNPNGCVVVRSPPAPIAELDVVGIFTSADPTRTPSMLLIATEPSWQLRQALELGPGPPAGAFSVGLVYGVNSVVVLV